MPTTSDQVLQLRSRLGIDRGDFARLAGVDTATVWRWETGRAKPTGAAAAVLAGLEQRIEGDGDVDQVIEIVLKAIAMGGLAYLIFKLLGAASQDAS